MNVMIFRSARTAGQHDFQEPPLIKNVMISRLTGLNLDKDTAVQRVGKVHSAPVHTLFALGGKVLSDSWSAI